MENKIQLNKKEMVLLAKRGTGFCACPLKRKCFLLSYGCNWQIRWELVFISLSVFSSNLFSSIELKVQKPSYIQGLFGTSLVFFLFDELLKRSLPYLSSFHSELIWGDEQRILWTGWSVLYSTLFLAPSWGFIQNCLSWTAKQLPFQMQINVTC